MSERKTPWTPGPYELDWEYGAIHIAGTNKPVAFLPVSFNGTEVGEATGKLFAEAPAMAELLRRAAFYLESPLASPLNAGEVTGSIRALLARIESA